jgi:hypothetical protein
MAPVEPTEPCSVNPKCGQVQWISGWGIYRSPPEVPQLVAAAKHLQQNWAKNPTEPMAKLNQPLDKAETVDRRKARKNSNRQSIPHPNAAHTL